MHKLRDWPLNEAFLFKTPPEFQRYNASEIVTILLKIYREWRMRYSSLQEFPWMELAFKVTWRWLDDKKVPLPRRLSDFLIKFGDYKLSSSFWGSLGNDIREKTPMVAEYCLRITNQFNWTPGAFGDGGSCMFESRSATKNAMAESGKFFALQHFTSENGDNPRGMAVALKDGGTFFSASRCWLFPTSVLINNVEEDIVVCFNSYGRYPLQQLAKLVQALTGAEATKRISVSNRNSTCGGVYVNSGGGIIVGSERALGIIEHIDFGFKNRYDGSVDRGFGLSIARGMRTTTGAVIGRTNPLGRTRSRKLDKPRSIYEMQQQDRNYYKKQLLNKKSFPNPKVRTFNINANSWSGNRRVKIKYKTFNKTLSEYCKSSGNYRGSTVSEQYMYQANRQRWCNILWYQSTLEHEFPRHGNKWRKKLLYFMAKNHYDVWPWITSQLKSLIIKK